jgi:hypothetical protein
MADIGFQIPGTNQQADFSQPKADDGQNNYYS